MEVNILKGMQCMEVNILKGMQCMEVNGIKYFAIGSMEENFARQATHGSKYFAKGDKAWK